MKLISRLLITLLLFSGNAFNSNAINSNAFAEGKQKEGQSLPLEELQVFAEVFGKIKSEYVDKADDITLLRDAIQGMLAGLDPHSSFLEPEAFKEMRITTEGKFGGLGIEVTTEDGFIKVVAPIDDTPAYHAGIQAGDVIVMLDGIPVRGMSLRDAVESMRGSPGSEIVLTISREGEKEVFDVTLVRAIINVTSVKGEILEEGFGYIRISSFQSGTGGNLRGKIGQLEKENGHRLKGLLLDLRNNPGGVLNSAVEVSDVFLDSGLIVSTRGRNAEADYSFSATPNDVMDDSPVVVLVNGGSASASEIVAGALQDHKRAIIMGTKTFGKGSVQTVIPMNNGGALKLTTARYYTPSDRSIQARGIVPDIIVEQAELTTTKQNGREIREADLAGHLENGDTSKTGENEEDPAGSDEKTRSDLVVRDYQVREALNLLKGMSMVKLRNEIAGPSSGEG